MPQFLEDNDSISAKFAAQILSWDLEFTFLLIAGLCNSWAGT